jgi:hypothetical protein
MRAPRCLDDAFIYDQHSLQPSFFSVYFTLLYIEPRRQELTRTVENAHDTSTMAATQSRSLANRGTEGLCHINY